MIKRPFLLIFASLAVGATPARAELAQDHADAARTTPRPGLVTLVAGHGPADDHDPRLSKRLDTAARHASAAKATTIVSPMSAVADRGHDDGSHESDGAGAVSGGHDDGGGHGSGGHDAGGHENGSHGGQGNGSGGRGSHGGGHG